MPTNSSTITGIHTSHTGSSRHGGMGDVHGPENELIRKEEFGKQPLRRLCLSAKLPDGVYCPTRHEQKGIFYCGDKLNCPIGKERG